MGAEGDNVYSFVDLINGSPTHYIRSDATPDDIAFFLYTGGTTGTPKGAMLSHGNLVGNAVQMCSWVWDASPQNKEVFLGVIPFFHSYGLTVVMNFAIAVAGAMVLLPRFVMKDALRAGQKYHLRWDRLQTAPPSGSGPGLTWQPPGALAMYGVGPFFTSTVAVSGATRLVPAWHPGSTTPLSAR